MSDEQDLTFDEWLEQIEAEYWIRGGDITGWSQVEQTGQRRWRELYDEGWSPEEALDGKEAE